MSDAPDSPPVDPLAPPAGAAEINTEASEIHRADERAAGQGGGKGAPNGRVVIKKYANRRLYNTQSSAYVTLEHLAEMVRQGRDFVVYDARTNDDITRQVLTQIIFEAENSGQNLLPVQFLRQLIGLYGGQMQAMTPSYLEASLDAFVRQGERMREQWAEAAAASPAVAPAVQAAAGLAFFEDQVRGNIAMFERAMKMFTPFPYRPADEAAAPPPRAPEPAPPPPERDDAVADLRVRMEDMQRQIESLARNR